MKSFLKEFKEFAMRGNVMDMAIGIVIGGAFTAIVTSLVGDIISPLLGSIGTKDLSALVAKINGVDVKYGAFIMAVVNFIIIAFVVFVMVKAMNKAATFRKTEEAEEEATTKECPYCKSEISIEATRCPHCTSVLTEEI